MATDDFWSAAFASSESINEKHDTPDWLIKHLKKGFNFDWDVCATRPNVCENYYTKEMDGLAQEWEGLCWLNPQYGREIGKWMDKAAAEASVKLSDSYENIILQSTVALVPSRTDTRWFQSALHNATSVTFIKGRLTFGSDTYWEWVWDQKILNGKKNSLYQKYGKKNSATFPSAILTFGVIFENQLEVLSELGYTITLDHMAVWR